MSLNYFCINYVFIHHNKKKKRKKKNEEKKKRDQSILQRSLTHSLKLSCYPSPNFSNSSPWQHPDLCIPQCGGMKA